MNLYVIRHAIAVEPGTPSYEQDSLRPLTDKGRKKMEAIAAGLSALEVQIDMILSSPYRRARETAEILVDVLKIESHLVLTENLTPMAEIDALIGEINEKYAVDSLALVGHEPFMSEFISTLLAGNSSVMVNMKKGGVCSLSIDNLLHDRRAVLEWMMTPTQMAKLGGA